MRLVKGMMLSVAAAALVASPVFAHVTVKPGEVLSGSYQTFTVSVPNEKDVATTSLRLEIPEALESVTPTVKQGWEIETTEEGEGEAAKVTSITWDGGEIPEGFRDEFTFSAKTPDEASELQWNAYQTYANGLVVAWNQAEGAEPEEIEGEMEYGPFSVTDVVAEASETTATKTGGTSNVLALLLSGAALLTALGAFAFASSRNSKKK